ncbi:MAG: glutathione synthase [Myxococcales bacterium FL481]|nr:MAG: glutathione synthase [Myxococcales bacterium FL481]
MDVLFVTDPLASLNPHKDSTYVMVTEAQRRGHRPYAVTLERLLLRQDRAMAHAVPLATGDGAARAPLVASGPAQRRDLATFDVVLMRKDPPFDQNYLIATWILEQAARDTLVLNDPNGLRDLNEKLSVAWFPELCPPTQIVRTPDDLHRALADFGGKMVVKPVFGYGGREILLAFEGDPNLSALFELATQEGARWTVAQAFLPAAAQGDKRVLLVDGKPIGAVTRIAARGEARNNFHTGGHAERAELSERDQEICAELGPFLSARGQFFVGLDIIGGLVTEINVTSPTGMQEINELHCLTNEHTMQALFWDRLEAKVTSSVRKSDPSTSTS